MSAAVAHSDIETKVLAERLALIYRLTPFTLAMAVLGSTLFLAVLWSSVPAPWLIAWYAVHQVVTLSRFLVVRAYQRANPEPAAAETWARRFVIGATAAGAMWGLAGSVLFPPAGDPAQLFVVTFLVGVVATGMLWLAQFLRAFLPLAGLALLPMALHLLLAGASNEQFAGLAALLFFFISIAAARRADRIACCSIRMRLRIEQLRDANDAARSDSTFWAEIPLAPTMQRPAEPVPAVVCDPVPPRLQGHVLLAEDNLVNQVVATAMLEFLGVRVRVAATGREVLDAVAAQKFDAVLMDWQMPEMDGFEAARAIRRIEKEKHLSTGARLPIVAVTANAAAGDRERCLAAGMDDYLAKPYRQAELHAILARWLPPEQPASVPAPEAATSS